jgi:hypothetical protein
MPRFYFDVRAGDKCTRDQEGQELANIEAMQQEATLAALSIASEHLSKESPELRVEVRDEAGHVILHASVSLNIESFDSDR